MAVRRWSALAASLALGAGCGGSDKSANVVPAPFPGVNGAAVGLATTTGDTGTSGFDASLDPATALSDGGVTTRTTSGDSGAGTGTAGDGGGDADDANAEPTCEEPLADLVEVQAITLNQGVQVTLMEDGETPWPRKAPVVQGREGLLRVWVEPQPGFVPHDIHVALTLTHGDVEETLTEVGQPTTGSDGDLGSTFNFELGAEQLGPDTELRVALLEDDCGAPLANPESARFPAQGDAPLQAEEVGPLRVKLVPVAYGGEDGSTPDVSEEALERYRDALMAFYPVSEVILTVREPLAWNYTVSAGGSGWEQLLDAVLNLAERERQPGEYFYGLFKPPGSARNYCSNGCVAGMAPVPRTGGFYGRPRATGGLGLAFDDGLSRDTLVHELGHAHGRDHAPCGYGVQGVDQSFPYDEGGAGVWGYDILTGQLKSPSRHADMMGYCEPIWISDYTYESIADWVADVNADVQPRVLQPKQLESQAWHSVLLLADGGATWGTWRPAQPPPGVTLTAEVLDERGAVIDHVDAVHVPLGDSDGGYLFVPQPRPEWQTLRVAGRELLLSALVP